MKLANVLGLFALALTGCASYQAPTLLPDPVMKNPPPRPAGFENKGWSGSFYGGDTGSLGGIPNSNNNVVDVNAGIVLAGGARSVPGTNDPWVQIQNVPLRGRDAAMSDLDSSLRQLDGAASIERMSQARPGLEAAHADAVSRLDAAMRDLDQRRQAMTEATDPGIWQSDKDQLHDAWQAVENAYSQAKATGN